MATALAHLAGDADAEAVVVVAGDVPDLDAVTVGRLVDAWRAAIGAPGEPPDAVVARTTRRQPLCAVWSAASLPRVDEQLRAGERAVHRALDRLRVHEVDVDPRSVADIDTPDQLRSRLGGERVDAHDASGVDAHVDGAG